MVFVDTEGLRELGRALDGISDDLVPAIGADPVGCGFPELVAACAEFDEVRQRAQVQAARQVEALARAVDTAAWRWERAEQLLGAG